VKTPRTAWFDARSTVIGDNTKSDEYAKAVVGVFPTTAEKVDRSK